MALTDEQRARLGQIQQQLGMEQDSFWTNPDPLDYRPRADAQAREDEEESNLWNELQGAGNSWLAGMGHVGALMGVPGAEEYAREEEANAARNFAASDWTKSYKDVDGFGSGLSYLGHNVVQSLPFIAEVGAGALTGGLGFGASLGKAGVKGAISRGAMKAAAKTQTKKQAAKQATRIAAAKQVGMEAAEKEARIQAGKRFARAGTGMAFSYPSSVGQIASAQYEQAGEYNPLVAAAGGVPFAALNMLGVEGAVLRGLPKSAAQRRIARAGAIGLATGAQEGAAETAQGLIEEAGRASVDDNYQFDDAARSRLAEAAVAGFTVGGALGTAGGGFTSPEAKIDYADEEGDARRRDTETLLAQLAEGQRAANNQQTAERNAQIDQFDQNRADMEDLLAQLAAGQRQLNNDLRGEQEQAAAAEAQARADLQERLRVVSEDTSPPMENQPALPMDMPVPPAPPQLMQPPLVDGSPTQRVPQAQGPVTETAAGQLPLPMSRNAGQGEIVSPDATFTPLPTTPDMFDQGAPEQYFESDWTAGELLARAARTLTEDPAQRASVRSNPAFRELARKLSDAMRLNDAAEVDLIMDEYQVDPDASPQVGRALSQAVEQWRAAHDAFYRGQGISKPRPVMQVKGPIRRARKRMVDARRKARDGGYSSERSANRALDKAEENLDNAINAAYQNNTPADRAAFRQRLLNPSQYPDFADTEMYDPNVPDPTAPTQGPPEPTFEQRQIEMDLQPPMQGPPPPLDRMQPRAGTELPLGPPVDPAQQRLPLDAPAVEPDTSPEEAARARVDTGPDLTPVLPAQGELDLDAPAEPADPAQPSLNFQTDGDASLDTEANDLFHSTLAMEQRGHPEAAMRRVREVISQGEAGTLFELVGDLTHRMAQMPERFKGGWGAAKVTDALRYLEDIDAFAEGLDGANAKIAGHRDTSVASQRRWAKDVMQRYAHEHSKLPVYNRNQWLAREAAVSLGRQEWSRARAMLSELQSTIDDGTYAQKNVEFTRNADGTIARYDVQTPTDPVDLSQSVRQAELAVEIDVAQDAEGVHIDEASARGWAVRMYLGARTASGTGRGYTLKGKWVGAPTIPVLGNYETALDRAAQLLSERYNERGLGPAWDEATPATNVPVEAAPAEAAAEPEAAEVDDTSPERVWERVKGGIYEYSLGDRVMRITKEKGGWVARAEFDGSLYGEPQRTLADARADADGLFDMYLGEAQEARRTSQHLGPYTVTETFAENVDDIDANLNKELKRMGLGRLKLRLRDRITATNRETGETYDIDGSFLNDVITVALDAKRGVMSAMKHETIHALNKAGVFTPAEWRALTRHAKRNMGNIDETYADLTPEQRVEEAIAVGYQNWLDNNTSAPNMITRAWNKVKRVLGAIGNALTGAGFNTADSIYRNIESGTVGNRGAAPAGTQGAMFSMREGMGRAFDDWFGDSVVVDDQGEPLVVYHGTSKDTDFKSFKPGSRGAWFTAAPETASEYAADNESRKIVQDPASGPWAMKEVNTADRVIPAYLSVQNPYTLTPEQVEGHRSATNYARFQRELVADAKRAGHDGILMPDGSYVVFDAKQIKSPFNEFTDKSVASPRFSRADASVDEAPRSFQVTEGGVEQVDGIGSIGEARTGTRSLMRKGSLKSMTIRQIVEVYEKIPEFGPALKGWFDNLTLVGAKAERGKRTADALYRRWNDLVTEEDQTVSDLMSDATWHQVDPRYSSDGGPNSNLEGEQLQKHTELRNRYLGLSQEAQSVYSDILDMHEANWKSRYEAMKKLVEETSGLSPTQRQEIFRDLDSLYGKIRVYSPLMRFGKYSLVAKSPEVIAAQARVDKATAIIRELDENLTDEEKASAEQEVQAAKKALAEAEGDGYFYMRYDKTGARQSAAQYLSDQGFAVQKYDGGDYSNGFDTIAPDFMRRLEQSFAGEENGDVFMRLARQAYVQSLPEGAAAKRGLQRSNVKGYSRNAKRAFVANAQTVSHQLAKLEYAASSRETMQALIDAEKKINGADNPNSDAAAAVLDQVRQHQQAAMDFVDTPLQDVMTNVSHLYFLAITPSFLMLNALQPFMVSAPMMSARHGVKAYARQAAWAKRMAGKKAVYGAALDINEITEDPAQRQFLEYVEERAMIDLDQTMDMGAEASTAFGKRWKQTMETVNRPIHITERVNRLSTGLAAFEMEYDRLLKEGKSKENAQAMASEYGGKMITDSHFDYSANNAPWLWKTPKLPISKVMLQFRKYQQHMIFAFVNNARNSFGDVDAQTKSEARRTLLGLFATHGLMAGSLGLPGAEAAMWGIGLVGSMLYGEDEPFDPRTEYRRFLADMLGPEAGLAIAKGLPATLGVDISQRQGVGNLFTPLQPRVAGLKPREEWNAYVASLLGPFGTVGGDIYQASQEIDDDWSRAYEFMLPKAIRDMAKTHRFSTEGLRTKAGMPLVGPEEFEASELLLQSLGLTPTRLTEFYEGRSSAYDYRNQIDERRRKLIREWADAKELDNDEIMAEMESLIDTFNEVRVEQGDKPVIKRRDLLEAVRRRRRYARDTVKGVRLRRSEKGLADVYDYAETFK